MSETNMGYPHDYDGIIAEIDRPEFVTITKLISDEFQDRYYVGLNGNDIILTNKILHDIVIRISYYKYCSEFGISIKYDYNKKIKCKPMCINTYLEDIIDIINNSVDKYKEFIEYCVVQANDTLSITHNINFNTNELVLQNHNKYALIKLSFIPNYTHDSIKPVIKITNSSLRNTEVYYLDSMNYEDVWDTIRFYL